MFSTHKLLVSTFLFGFYSLNAQRITITQTEFIKKIYDEALINPHAYSRLGELCKEYGARLSGSDQTEAALDWSVNMLNSYSFDSVYKQPVLVPRWERGEISRLNFSSPWLTKNISTASEEIAQKRFPNSPAPRYECDAYINSLGDQISSKTKIFPVQVTALGGSISGKVSGSCVAVASRAELDSLGELGELQEKIVLLNRPFEEEFIRTFMAYGSCVNQRVYGAVWCAPYGAKAVLVRSMSNSCDLHPHTGVTYYDDTINKIPIAAISTAAADAISFLSKKDPKMKLDLELSCQTLDDRLSANVIAQSDGLIYPKSVIAFGGHFDSWDEGEGAHDDGAGIMHCFEALRILKQLNYQPRHTLRCVWWINEENGLKGALKYAELAKESGDIHVVALESDRGGFTPRGFALDSMAYEMALPYREIFAQYGAGEFEIGGGGADIGPIKKNDNKTQLVAFVPDSQRYFDVHHADTDIFENVNKRELQLGAAAIAAMIYVLDQTLD
jgi:hypothetical protein